MSTDDNHGLLSIDRRTAMKGIGVAGLATALGGSAAAQTQETASRHGPYRTNRFLVEIDGIATASFSRVELPDTTIASVEYRDGNDMSGTRKLSGNTEDDTLLLETGITDSLELFEWFKLARQGKVEEARRNVAVVLLNARGEPGPRWEFTNAWPARYASPDLDALSKGVAIETLELLHEGMERVA